MTSKRKVNLEARKREVRKIHDGSIALEDAIGTGPSPPGEHGDSIQIGRKWNNCSGPAVSMVGDLPRDALIQYVYVGGGNDENVGAAENQICSVNLEKTPGLIPDTRKVDLEIQRFHQSDRAELISGDRRNVSTNMADSAEDEIEIQDGPPRGTQKEDVTNLIESRKPRKAIRQEVEGRKSYRDISDSRLRSKTALHASPASRVRANPLVRSKGRKGGISKSRIRRDNMKSIQRSKVSKSCERSGGSSSVSPKMGLGSSANVTKELTNGREDDSDESTSYAEYLAWKASKETKGNTNASMAQTRRKKNTKVQRSNDCSKGELDLSEDTL